MIRDTGQVASDFTNRRVRFDRPSLRMPAPHFNARTSENTLKFLDEALGRLQDRNTTTQEVGDTIREIYAVLHVRRSSCSSREWSEFIERARQHPLCEALHEDAFTRRAYIKPRGYAGDAALLDHMYATEHGWSPPEMSWLGQRIHRWTTYCSACEGVKARREIIARLIDGTAGDRRDAEIMSLAAGHLREAEFSRAIVRNRLARTLAIDSDVKSLQLIERDYGRYGVQTMHASARELISGKLEVGRFDFIYTSGLCDYLSDSMCQRLADNLFQKLKPGGKLLLTNFVDGIEAIGYMEVYMDWNLIYRDRMQMMEMTARIPDRMIRNVTCFSEENHNVIFVLIERA